MRLIAVLCTLLDYCIWAIVLLFAFTIRALWIPVELIKTFLGLEVVESTHPQKKRLVYCIRKWATQHLELFREIKEEEGEEGTTVFHFIPKNTRAAALHLVVCDPFDAVVCIEHKKIILSEETVGTPLRIVESLEKMLAAYEVGNYTIKTFYFYGKCIDEYLVFTCYDGRHFLSPRAEGTFLRRRIAYVRKTVFERL